MTTLAELKQEILQRPLKMVNGFKPVIVSTEYAKNKFSFGVQFWSDFLINAKRSTNSDKSIATLVEVL